MALPDFVINLLVSFCNKFADLFFFVFFRISLRNMQNVQQPPHLMISYQLIYFPLQSLFPYVESGIRIAVLNFGFIENYMNKIKFISPCFLKALFTYFAVFSATVFFFIFNWLRQSTMEIKPEFVCAVITLSSSINFDFASWAVFHAF